MSTNKSCHGELKRLAKNIMYLHDELQVSDKRISEHMADELVQKIETKYSAYLHHPKIDKNQNRGGYPYVWSEPTFYRGKTTVHVVGHQVVYDEFGTGERGLFNPHPALSGGGPFGEYNYDFRKKASGHWEYNSGSHIKWDEKHQTHYWIWRGVHTGEPAGAFVYNSIMELYDEKNGIAHEDINQVYKKTGFKSTKKR